jgi:glycosyltransferase involved in cell wall biosynthesis
VNVRSSDQRILIVSDTMPPDPNGIALIAFHTPEILSKTAAVHVVGPSGAQFSPAVRYSSVKRLPIGTPDLHLPRPSFRLVSDAVSAADQIVVHTLGPLGCAALHYARRFGKHSTLFLHNDYPALLRYGLPPTIAAPAVNWLAGRLQQWADGVATRVVAPGGTPREGYEVLRLSPPRYPVAAAAAGGNGHITVAYHGRVSREKALDATVRAIHAADPRHRRLRFRIIGDGSQLASTLRLAAALGVPVEHVPWSADPRPALCGAQIYVTASRIETFSMTTLEAIGCGLPLIARSVGQIPSYVQHDVNGLLFDSDEQLPALLDALASDSRTRVRLAAEAQASSSDRTLWEQFAEASIGAPPF